MSVFTYTLKFTPLLVLYLQWHDLLDVGTEAENHKISLTFSPKIFNLLRKFLWN